jgi:cell division protein FtsI/penicillin-binding protein 2
MNSLNPVRTLRKIHNLEDLKYTIRVGKLGIESALQSILTGKFFSQKIMTERVAKKMAKNQERFKNDIKLPLKAC